MNLRSLAILIGVVVLTVLGATRSEASTFSLKFFHADGTKCTDSVTVVVTDSAGMVKYSGSSSTGSLLTSNITSTQSDVSLTFVFTRGGNAITIVGLNGQGSTTRILDVVVP